MGGGNSADGKMCMVDKTSGEDFCGVNTEWHRGFRSLHLSRKITAKRIVQNAVSRIRIIFWIQQLSLYAFQFIVDLESFPTILKKYFKTVIFKFPRIPDSTSSKCEGTGGQHPPAAVSGDLQHWALPRGSTCLYRPLSQHFWIRRHSFPPSLCFGWWKLAYRNFWAWNIGKWSTLFENNTNLRNPTVLTSDNRVNSDCL